MSIDRRILIADDDCAVSSGAAELLGPMGLDVILATSGLEALDILRTHKIHVALLDMHMPGKTGLEVFDLIRLETPDLPCIFWSGDSTGAIEIVAMRAGAHAFLHKPVQPELLRFEVRRALRLDEDLGMNRPQT